MQYSFSTQPRAVAAGRSKYRDPSSNDTFSSNIMFDRRVVRGNTYAGNAPEDDRQEDTAPKRKRRITRPHTPPSLFDIQPQLTQHIAVPLEQYLVEQKEVKQEVEVQTQTSRFMIRPKTPPYVPKKTGIDVSTQIEPEDELFNFDIEVEPILDVLVGKILEQGQLEVEEEYELAALSAGKAELLQDNLKERQRIQQLEEEERQKWARKEELKKLEMARLARERQLCEKVASRQLVGRLFGKMQPNVFQRLSDAAFFVDPVRADVQSGFMPWLMDAVGERVEAAAASRRCLDRSLANSLEIRKKRVQEAAAYRQAEKERLALEALRARLLTVSLQSEELLGGDEPVGPMELDGTKTVGELAQDIHAWLVEFVEGFNPVEDFSMTLYANGEQLENEKSLKDQGVENGSVLRTSPDPDLEEDED